MLIDENHPLATVKDAFNAVFVHGDAMDDAMFMGRGAGEMPTASAVMGDIIDVIAAEELDAAVIKSYTLRKLRRQRVSSF